MLPTTNTCLVDTMMMSQNHYLNSGHFSIVIIRGLGSHLSSLIVIVFIRNHYRIRYLGDLEVYGSILYARFCIIGFSPITGICMAVCDQCMGTLMTGCV